MFEEFKFQFSIFKISSTGCFKAFLIFWPFDHLQLHPRWEKNVRLDFSCYIIWIIYQIGVNVVAHGQRYTWNWKKLKILQLLFNWKKITLFIWWKPIKQSQTCQILNPFVSLLPLIHIMISFHVSQLFQFTFILSYRYSFIVLRLFFLMFLFSILLSNPADSWPRFVLIHSQSHMFPLALTSPTLFSNLHNDTMSVFWSRFYPWCTYLQLQNYT